MKKIKTIQQKIRANIKKARTTRKAPSRKVEAPPWVRLPFDLLLPPDVILALSDKARLSGKALHYYLFERLSQMAAEPMNQVEQRILADMNRVAARSPRGAKS
jgi:hypothetical protein